MSRMASLVRRAAARLAIPTSEDMLHHIASNARPIDVDPKWIETDPVRYIEQSSNYRGPGALSLYQPLPSEGLMVYQKTLGNGYTISDRFVQGSFILTPRHLFFWNVNEIGDVTPASLALATHTYPQIEGILLGYGETDSPARKRLLLNYCHARGMKIQCVPTIHALAKWNQHMEDRRNIIGFFVGKRPWGAVRQNPWGTHAQTDFGSVRTSPDMDVNLRSGQAGQKGVPFEATESQQVESTIYNDSGGRSGFSASYSGHLYGEPRGLNVRAVYPDR